LATGLAAYLLDLEHVQGANAAGLHQGGIIQSLHRGPHKVLYRLQTWAQGQYLEHHRGLIGGDYRMPD